MILRGVFCYGDEENGHGVYTSGHLTTTNQSEIRNAYHVSVAMHPKEAAVGRFCR